MSLDLGPGSSAAAFSDGPPVDARRRRVEIQPSGAWPRVDLGELWRYRGLFAFLVWRDIKVRYAQTVLGAGWAIIQPVVTMLVFTVIFGQLVGVKSDGAPYAVFSLTALVPWTYFSGAIRLSSNSLVANPALVTKVYFPRLVIPLAPVLAGLVDYAIALVILLGMLVFYGIAPSPAALFVLPLLTLLMMMTSAGVGCWLSALNIQYRDVKHTVPFIVQIWMYASPIIYPMSQIPERFRGLYALNPLVGVIEGFRAVLLQTVPIPWRAIGVSAAAAVLLLTTGAVYFRRMERNFADVA